ncbi:galactose-1-phosphate uridylyltransferase [Anaerolineales bacterium HSG6]|nr:galactose-1-phosphate uridylyltransferase [Anaerolineales bacterium HSG6]MDM8529994.1 galactose-1-phosphate uridylyltransferase [Anaerolineales bacterium HSG25]
MPEIRQNLVTREWVIISTERAKRPDVYIESHKKTTSQLSPPHDERCPFCVGNEELDLEVARIPLIGDWQTRVVLNRYPALSSEGEVVRTMNGVVRKISGVGQHEVLVEHPVHNTTLSLMSVQDIARVLTMCYDRGWAIRKDTRIEQIIYFKNHGERAGASLKHPHSQIIGLPVVPHSIRRRIDEMRRFFDDTGQCVMCSMMDKELKDRKRIVSESEHFVAFVLYAAPTPFHTWIVPRQHNVSYLYSSPQELNDLAGIVRDVLRRLYFGLNDPDYNFIIRTAPVKELSNDYMHWYATVVPRLSRTAGFELGSGMFINPALPEESAEYLRTVKI